MNFININVIADKLKRHPLMQDIPFETIIDYTIDFIRIVGTPPSFYEKTAFVDINNYRAELPCDYYIMLHMRCGNTYFNYTEDYFHTSFHKHPKTGFTYKIQNGIIITSIEKGKLEIAYRAMPIGEDGLPLIPDNSTYTRALELYIKLQWFTMLFDMGKIQPAVLQNTQQQYAWAVGQAQTDLIRPTMDQMEMITKMWTRLLRKEPAWYVHTNSRNHDKLSCEDKECRPKSKRHIKPDKIEPTPEPKPEGCTCMCPDCLTYSYILINKQLDDCACLLYMYADGRVINNDGEITCSECVMAKYRDGRDSIPDETHYVIWEDLIENN